MTARGIDPGQVSEQALSIQRVRADLAARLRERLDEIEETILTRITSLSESREAGDAEYAAGLRMAVKESVAFGIASIEHGEEWTPPLPPAVEAQAQRAARNGISLDTVLRRYAAGDRILGEFIVEEGGRLPGQVISLVMKGRGPMVDRLMAHAATQYMRELERMRRSPEQRRTELVERLLAGDVVIDMTELDYDFEGWHVGTILSGEGAEAAARAAAAKLNRSALIVPRGTRTAWAWLGGRKPLDLESLEGLLDEDALAGVSLAIGEPRQGLEGWRLSHQEAHAGYQVMLRKPRRLVRGTEVLLLAAVMRDSALAKSLLSTYLTPLDDAGDAAPVLRRTLRAYFASSSNAATAAAVLEVDRHTVQRRLRKVEELLGRLLNDCQTMLEVALSLEEIGGVSPLDEAVSDSWLPQLQDLTEE